MFALPLPKKTWPLVLTPTFDAYLMDVPRSIDLPARFYDAYPGGSPGFPGFARVAAGPDGGPGRV